MFREGGLRDRLRSRQSICWRSSICAAAGGQKARLTGPLVINRLLEGHSIIRSGIEEFSRVHPGLGLFKHCLSIGLRDDAFADAKTANVDSVAKALGNLVDEVVLVALRFKRRRRLAP